MRRCATSDQLSQSDRIPPSLAALLGAAEHGDLDDAWTRFAAEHSAILLHTCRTVAHDRDAAMDGFAHVLAALREDRCRRLRAYAPTPGARFTTWLVVVTRRLVLDHIRQRYGRARSTDDARREEQVVRRRLENLVAAEIDPDVLSTTDADGPDGTVRGHELAAALRDALGELDPPDRLLLALRFEDERPVREIAKVLGFPSVFHVYRRLAAALALVREALARRGVLEPEP
jgi:RNA polymerase sigma factor (sigma-70 family)